MSVLLAWPIKKPESNFNMEVFLFHIWLCYWKGNAFYGNWCVEKKKHLNGSTVYKYMKPKILFPVLHRLVSWAHHLFSSNGICLNFLFPPTCKGHWARRGKFLSSSAVLKRSKASRVLFGEILRGRLFLSVGFGQTVCLLQVGGLNDLQTV